METMKTLTKRLFRTCLGLVVIISLCLGLGLGGASSSMAAPFKPSNDLVHIPHAIVAYSDDHEDDREDTTIYKVVVNHEEQYSIWPAYRENPLGWRDVGKNGTRQEVLEYIKEVWTDMRPLSLRKAMERSESQKEY